MKIFAHRGASGHAPENTMEAFKLAYEMGADGIELDVQLTSDNELVVTHDEDIERTSNGKGLVMNKTYFELCGYDFGSWYSDEFVGVKIPKLGEVLDWIKTNSMELNIEIKTMPAWYNKKLTQRVFGEVKNSGIEDRIIISSFDHQAILDMRELSSSIKTAALYESNILHPWEYCEKYSINCIHPYYLCATKSLVESCHSNNIEVNVWTVNDIKEALKLKKMGVDCIITNYPMILDEFGIRN